MSVHEHRHAAPKSVTVTVCTVSDTRTEATDKSGQLVQELLLAGGHRVNGYKLIKDESHLVEDILLRFLATPEFEALIFTGGTGIAPRDVTADVLLRTPEIKLLPRFGELFRMLSYAEIGAAAMLSRACAFVSANQFIAVLPGSSAAVRLAMEKLIVPELGHTLGMLRG